MGSQGQGTSGLGRLDALLWDRCGTGPNYWNSDTFFDLGPLSVIAGHTGVNGELRGGTCSANRRLPPPTFGLPSPMAAITRQDLMTILLFATHVAKVDNEFVLQEKELLHKFAEAIKLTPDERGQLLKREASLADGLNHLSSNEAKQLLVKTLCAVSHSDGKAVKAELDFIHKVIEHFEGSVFVLPREEWGKYETEVMKLLSSISTK
jgi:tellurite resistance protein